MISKKRFKEICKKVRISIIENSYKAKACHIGSALSCVEILVDIYFNKLKKNDIFIFSKASGVAALYSVLAEKRIIPHNKIAFYLKNYPLPNRKVPGVLIDGGSLGHGLAIAVGIALTNKKRDIYCLMSDGEFQEGTAWESLLFKKQHKLDNLKIYCDWNKFQACGKIKDILDIPWDFIKSMGVKVVDTIKGAGVDFLENKVESHYVNLNEDTYQDAIRQLSA